MAPSNASRLTDKAKTYVTAALKEDFTKTNEHVTWDVNFAVFPDPSPESYPNEDGGDPSAAGLLPALVIYLELAGAKPDTSVYLTTILAPYQLTSARVSKDVHAALKVLRESRNKQLDNESVEPS